MIWILVLILLASGVGMGLRLGAIPNAFAFVGIVVGTLFAGLTGALFKALLPHVGIKDPILLWITAPIAGFLLVYVLFTAIGFEVHRRVNVYYKYKAGDLRLALWERLNLRLGACVGVLNGAAWLVLISFFIFNFSYWTAQVASSDNEAKMTRLMNSLGQGLQDTGLDKAARAVGSMPTSFYKTADFAGLLMQNPKLSTRLGNYPAFLSLGQQPDIQQLAQDGTLAQDWQNGAPLGAILNESQVKTILADTNLMATVWNVIQTNMDDITNYLITGKSPKYDPEKIVGRWSFDVTPTLANFLVTHPKVHLTHEEMKQLRLVWDQLFAQTTLIAGTDGQLFLKSFPQLGSKQMTTEDATGQWSGSDTNYDLSLNENGQTESVAAQTDGLRLTFTVKGIPFVCERIY